MTQRRMGWILIMLLVAAIGPGSTSGQDSGARPASAPRVDYRERYSIISEQNIFLRDRRRRRNDSDDRRRDRPPPRREEEFYALRGVVFEEGEYRAYMENLSSYSILRLGIGDPVAHGRVSQIALDAIEYEQGGQHTWVEVGRNLTGATATSSPAASQPSEPSSESGAASATPINPNDPNLTIEQKMKLRRMQQTGGK